MPTEIDITKSIMKTTTEILDKFPELSKFIDEMPTIITNENSAEINQDSLQNYQESLNSLLTKYQINHSTIKNKSL